MRTALLVVAAAALGFVLVRAIAPARPRAAVDAPAAAGVVERGEAGLRQREAPAPRARRSIRAAAATVSEVETAVDLVRLRAEDPGAWSAVAEGVDRALARLIIDAVARQGGALSLEACRASAAEPAPGSIEVDVDVVASSARLAVSGIRPASGESAWREACVAELLEGTGEASDLDVDAPFPEVTFTTRVTLPVDLGSYFAAAARP
jgi:hypothetical protein